MKEVVLHDCKIQKKYREIEGEKNTVYSTHLYVWLVRKEGSREKMSMALYVD
jgi:hypothetical protein